MFKLNPSPNLTARLLLLAVAAFSVNAIPLRAQDTKPDQSATQAPVEPTLSPDFPDLKVPANATLEQLKELVQKAKQVKPKNTLEFKAMQTGIKDASNALSKMIKEKDDPVRMQAELDFLSSAAALMVNESEAARDSILERLTKYFDDRKEVTLSDVQSGLIIAFYLEQQPRKAPARDFYAMLDKRLEDDQREEMQAIRYTLKANMRRLELLGNKFEIEATAIDGKKIKTDDFAGKYVIVDFFATWCAPCIAEVPRLQNHYSKYREKGLEVIAINLDDEREALDKFLKDHPLPWPVIHDKADDPMDKLQMKFGILALPTVMLLNKEGTVVSLEARGPELDRLMERLFEMPTPAEEQPEKPKEEAAKDASKEATDAKPAKQ